MTDYSKPIGWWCPHCGPLTRGNERQDAMAALLRGMLRGPVIAWMHASGCTRGDHADTIPVFAEIPEGARPQTTWDEPEVVTSDSRGAFIVQTDDCSRAVMHLATGWWAWTYTDPSGWRDDIGDAVLWVVEGRAP